jgi:hypothetical protein
MDENPVDLGGTGSSPRPTRSLKKPAYRFFLKPV